MTSEGTKPGLRMLLRLTALAMSIAILAAFAAACGGEEPVPTTAPAPTTAAPAAAPTATTKPAATTAPVASATPAKPGPTAGTLNVAVAIQGRKTLSASAYHQQGGLEGQCTTFAEDKMFDATGLWMPQSRHARYWADDALANGWNVGTTPRVASVMVMPATEFRYELKGDERGWTATRVDPLYGHVAWVDQVDGDWVHVLDSNFHEDLKAGSRWIKWRGSPVQFIYADI